MSILQLPPELLREVLMNLSPFDLQAVAKTFNKSLHHVANRLLEPKRQWLRQMQESFALFPPGTSASQRQLLSPYPGYVRPLEASWGFSNTEFPASRYKEFGLDPAKAPYFRMSPPELADWMTFDGSFAWLKPLTGEVATAMQAHYGSEGDHPVAQGWQVDILIQQVKGLNLQLPQGFETFLRSNVLHHRMPSTFMWFFRLSKLIKCPATIDGGHGGYIVRFYCDQQFCAFDYLYFSPSGNYFIIRSQEDLYSNLFSDTIVAGGESDAGLNDNASDHNWGKDEVSLVGLNFEEHLASVYFEEHLNFKAPAFPELIEYVQNVYKSRA